MIRVPSSGLLLAITLTVAVMLAGGGCTKTTTVTVSTGAGSQTTQTGAPNEQTVGTGNMVSSPPGSNTSTFQLAEPSNLVAPGRVVLTTQGTPAAVVGVMPDGTTIGIADPGNNFGSLRLFDEQGSLLLTRGILYLMPHDSPFIAFRSLVVTSRSVVYLLLEHQDGFKINQLTVTNDTGMSTYGMHLVSGATAGEVIVAGADVRAQGGEIGGLSYAVMVDGKPVPETEQPQLAKAGLLVGDTWVRVSWSNDIARFSAQGPERSWQVGLRAASGERLTALRFLGQDDAGNLHVLARVETVGPGSPQGRESFVAISRSPYLVRVVFSPRGEFRGQQTLPDDGANLSAHSAMDKAGTVYRLVVAGESLEVHAYPAPAR